MTLKIKGGPLATIPAAADREPLFPTDVFRFYVGFGGVNRLLGVLHKIDGTTAPTASNDSSQGYSAGSEWIDITNSKGYVCHGATAGAAVWKQFSGTGAGTTYAADESTLHLSAGNQFSILSSYSGQTSITTLGTIATGTWQGAVIAEIYGGTNQSSYTLGDTLYASAANTLSKLPGNTTATKKFLRQTGTGAVSAAPVWDTVGTADLPQGTDGQLIVGQTGAASLYKTVSGSGATITMSAGGVLAISAIANASLTNYSITLNAGTNVGLTAPGAMSLGSTYTFGATTDNVRFNDLGLGVAAPTGGGQIQTQLGANALDALIIQRFTDTSPTGNFVRFNNATGTPLFSIDITGSVTGSASWKASPITASYGGTGLATLTANAVILGNGTGVVGFATIGTAGSLLIDQGAGVNPAFKPLSGSGATFSLSSAGILTLNGFTANQDMGGFKITGAADPTNSGDYVTLNYFQNSQVVKQECQTGTVTTLAAYSYNNGASGVGATITMTVAAILVLDGYTPVLNDRILVKNETGGNQPYNGIYSLTTVGTALIKAVLTRTTDFDQATDGINGAFVFIQNGTVNAKTGWLCNTFGSITFGTTNINWVQDTGSGTYTGSGTISVSSSNVISIGAPFGATTITNHGVVLGAGTSNLGATAVGATNTLLHGNTGADPTFSAVVEADLSLTDLTTANASTTAHGFLKKLSNTATQYMDGTGAWTVPVGQGNTISTGAIGGEPASPSVGDVFMPNNGFSLERKAAGGWVPWGPIFPFTVPADPGSWANQGSATLTTYTNEALYLSCPSDSSAYKVHFRYKAAPATTKATTIAFIPLFYAGTVGYGNCGFAFQDSVGGKLVLCQAMTNNDGHLSLNVFRMTDVNTYSSTPAGPLIWNHGRGGVIFFKCQDDGTNLTFKLSTDGVNFFQFYSEGRTAWLAAAPDRTGIHVLPYSSAVGMTVLSYLEA